VQPVFQSINDHNSQHILAIYGHFQGHPGNCKRKYHISFTYLGLVQRSTIKILLTFNIVVIHDDKV
jgi:hypothetical protein